MKFRCERELLADALTTAGRAATGRSAALPVLSGVRLELTSDQLTVTGTDLDLTIQLGVTVGGDSDGGVVLPARLAAEIVRSLSDGKVEVAVATDDVSITGGRSQFSVRPLSIDDYPRLPTPATEGVTVPAATFGPAPGRARREHRREPPDPHGCAVDRRERRVAYGGHRFVPPGRA